MYYLVKISKVLLRLSVAALLGTITFVLWVNLWKIGANRLFTAILVAIH